VTYEEMMDLIGRFSKGASLVDMHGWRAVVAVMEVHKYGEYISPTGEVNKHCQCCDIEMYPCPTVQAIEKELG